MSYAHPETSASLMKWNMQLKDRRGAQNYIETLLEAARMATITRDGLGIVWALLSVTEFAEMFPEEIRAPLEHPGEQPQTAQERMIWEYKLKQFDEQQIAIRRIYINAIGPNGVPQHIQRNMRDGAAGMATRDIAFVYKYLKENYTTYLEEDIDDLERVFDTPWTPGVDIRAFTSEAIQVFEELGKAGCPINEFYANRRMRAKFPLMLWQPCWTQHSITHGSISKLKVRELAADIIKFHDQHLPRTPSAQLYHSVAAVTSEDADAMFANQMARFQAAQEPKAKPYVSYCWSHGPNFSKQHTSQQCRTPKPGHVPTATLNNKCGGHA